MTGPHQPHSSLRARRGTPTAFRDIVRAAGRTANRAQAIFRSVQRGFAHPHPSGRRCETEGEQIYAGSRLRRKLQKGHLLTHPTKRMTIGDRPLRLVVLIGVRNHPISVTRDCRTVQGRETTGGAGTTARSSDVSLVALNPRAGGMNDRLDVQSARRQPADLRCISPSVGFCYLNSFVSG